MLKYLSTRSKGILLTIVFLLFFSCFLSTAIAQVTIKEKIELNGLPENNLKKNTSVASALIMPSSGKLQVYYAYVNHFDYPLPDYSTLNSYFFRGDSSKVDSIMPRLAEPTINYETLYDYCYGQITYRQVYYYNSSNDPNEYLYNVGNVNQGDTVQFTYFSDNIETGDTITYGMTDTVAYYQNGELVGWDVTFGWYDECIFRYINVLQIFVGVMKDYDLLVNIEPEILYPGDTASVVIKKLMLQDSSIVDFDSSQTFEVAKLEGCIWGDILAEDSLGAYFYGAHQPIKFVVDTSTVVIDSLASDSGIVKLGVGVIEPNNKRKFNLKPFEVTDCFVGTPATNLSPAYTEVDNPLEIIEPTSMTEEKFITSTPAMPVLTVKAKMNNYNTAEFNFNWKYIQSWTNNVEDPKRKIQETYEGNCPGFLSNIATWEIDFGSDIIGGDKDTLYVYVYDGPRIYTRSIINPYKILGSHLSPEEVRADLNLHEQIVVYLESLPKWQHFSNDGFPIFGPPHGYG